MGRQQSQGAKSRSTEWEMSRVSGPQSKIQESLLVQLGLDVDIGWGGCARDI